MNEIGNQNNNEQMVVPQQNNQYNMQNQMNAPVNQDEELLKAYIGKNYEEIKQQKFNVPAFFLTTPYLFYRKKYLWGVLYMIIGLIAELLVSNSSTIICILIGVFFNKYYIQDSKKQIEKIKNQNIGLSPDSLKGILITKGGTNLAAAIILTIILILLTIVAVVGIVFAMVMPVINQSMNYDYDTSINIKDKFVFENKMDFDDVSDENSYAYDYEPLIDEYDSCSIYLHKVKNYNSAEKFIEEHATEDYKTNPLRKNANDIEWLGYINQTLLADFHIYVTEIDGEVYVLEYDIFGISESGPCHEYKENVFEYIKTQDATIPIVVPTTPSDDIIMQY